MDTLLNELSYDQMQVFIWIVSAALVGIGWYIVMSAERTNIYDYITSTNIGCTVIVIGAVMAVGLTSWLETKKI